MPKIQAYAGCSLKEFRAKYKRALRFALDHRRGKKISSRARPGFQAIAFDLAKAWCRGEQ